MNPRRIWSDTKKIYTFLLVILFSCSTSLAHATLQIQSRSAVVMDAATGKILYAKNPYLKRAPASTTKLITAMIVLDMMKLTDTVKISRHAMHIAPHKAGFQAGDKVTIENLLYAALLDSANDAAVALAEAVSGTEARFVKRMNRKAAAIGARNTRFINASGLPGRGQYTTAYDLAKIMNYALRYAKLRQVIGTRVTEISTKNGNGIFLKNTNKLLWSEDDLVGGKTGYTRSARHCFVCAAERNDSTIIVAILGSPNRKSLWKESEMLISRGFDVLSRKKEPMIVFSGSDKNTRKTSVTKKNTALKEKIQITKKKKKAKTAIRNRASGGSIAEGQDEGNGQCSVNDRDEYEGDKG